jgi:hypothetical protein
MMGGVRIRHAAPLISHAVVYKFNRCLAVTNKYAHPSKCSVWARTVSIITIS